MAAFDGSDIVTIREHGNVIILKARHTEVIITAEKAQYFAGKLTRLVRRIREREATPSGNGGEG